MKYLRVATSQDDVESQSRILNSYFLLSTMNWKLRNSQICIFNFSFGIIAVITLN